MNRSLDLDAERLREESPTALEDVNREPFPGGLESDA
jgi:hypothetical protein